RYIANTILILLLSMLNYIIKNSIEDKLAAANKFFRQKRNAAGQQPKIMGPILSLDKIYLNGSLQEKINP
ncbi:hypothetical protein ACJX0J_039709, partial [Zea mays]